MSDRYAGYRKLRLEWPQERVLFVADVHLGKAASFRAAGVAMPGGHSAHDLERIAALLDEHQASRLVILGDLIHTRESYTTTLDHKFRQFRKRHRHVAMTLVRGNHEDCTRAGTGWERLQGPGAADPCTVHDPLYTVTAGKLTLAVLDDAVSGEIDLDRTRAHTWRGVGRRSAGRPRRPAACSRADVACVSQSSHFSL